ncbi:MAG: NADH-ubiquinone oxidoreductase-F iron-sulfur binding region domain-containing protein [Planctomycetota bacterium]|jgi:NADH-quinone oxidoreductase subunit F
MKLTSPEELECLRKSIVNSRDPDRPEIVICSGTGCHACGCEALVQAFTKDFKKKKISNKVGIKTTGCHGFCERGPITVIRPKGIFYQRVGVEDVEEIVSETIQNNRIVERLLYVDPTTGKRITYEKDVPFYAKQTRQILGNNGLIDPERIDDYVAIGGYSALNKALFHMEPEQVITQVIQSKLRGRGGGGFPTGWKWDSCRNAESQDDTRYIICNADEGDPGAYMDRSVLEGNPHSILEGMTIGAYAIGSHNGFIYVRNEYPLAVKNVSTAIHQARSYGLLGENILGSGFDFDIKVSKGGGAFVCGESTALMASLEGRVGRPRAKYVHTVEKGFHDKPSNLNNVETWANIPLIINKGAEWYSKTGTEGSKGTKIFSLVGKINNTGLVEVPMGITLREIIYDIGGGIPNNKKFKAVQTGGPSGGCIPEYLIDLPVDFDELTKIGSMMGSGGMIVMDEDTCMVDVARYFLNFLKEESCGKCIPCPEGIKRMLEILDRICHGEGTEGDIQLLEELSRSIMNSALCALGTTAPNPVLSTLQYFRDEYEAHIRDKACPAGVCADLFEYFVDDELCTGCGRCKKECPTGAISGVKKESHMIDSNKCIKCGVCFEVCKFEAVKKGSVEGVKR